jgi:hypothetical protein
MSKERELLKELITRDMVEYYYPTLVKKVEELLAQPEPTAEPVAWMQDSIELYVLEEKSAIRGYVIPLYTAPPTREPIDTRRITLKMFSESVDMQYKNGYVDGIRFAEKMHGIGGGE